jgi:hypothetical protein
MKTLILFGLTFLVTSIGECQYFQRHAGSRFELKYLIATTPLSTFKGAFPLFKQAPFAVIPDTADYLKRETSQPVFIGNPSLQKAVQYQREYEKRKIDFRPVLEILYSIYQLNHTGGRRPF